MDELKSIHREPLIQFVKARSKQVMDDEHLASLSSLQLCVLGAASERIDPSPLLLGLLKIYEQVWRSSESSPDLLRWARERWLVIKQKKIVVDEESAEEVRSRASDDEEIARRSESLTKARQELSRRRTEWSIHERLGDYPDAVPDPAAQPVSGTGDLENVAEEGGIRKVALNLLKMNMPNDQIAKATGLDIREIERLARSRS